MGVGFRLRSKKTADDSFRTLSIAECHLMMIPSSEFFIRISHASGSLRNDKWQYEIQIQAFTSLLGHDKANKFMLPSQVKLFFSLFDLIFAFHVMPHKKVLTTTAFKSTP
jgi:hypothetical protein